MTNLPLGTTVTKPAPRRRLNRVITLSALAAGALATIAVPAQAATGWTPDQSARAHGTGFRTMTDPRNTGTDCGNRPHDNGGRHHHNDVSSYHGYVFAAAICTPASYPAAPVTTWSPPTPAPTRTRPSPPVATTAPVTSTPGTARGATTNYNEGYAGSCVYYALDRFHQYTGVYPRAFGDARYLATGAAASGWSTGTTPRINSLVVFQPGQNGAGSPTGHVAWVEQVSGNQIYIAEMNAPTAYVITHRWVIPVSGVRYVYA